MLATVNRKILRKMSFLSDQKGIVRRYNREKNNWNLHLENSKKFILKSVENQSKKSIAILGSGWCLDVPVEELSKQFSKVYLIDIFHPSEIEKLTKTYENLIFIEADITNGLIERVFNFVQENKKKKVEDLNFDFLLQIPQIQLNEYDFVVSLNILNQLDILLLDYLKQYFKISDEKLAEIRKFIQDYHVEMLPKSKSCLIADYEEVLIDKKQNIVKTNSSIFTQKIDLKNAQKWVWNFDTKMRYYDEFFTNFNVLALKI
jgi:hypothetical protein